MIALPTTEISSPAVVESAAGRTDLFLRSSGGDLIHQYRLPGGSWTRGINLGGDLASQPAAVSWGPGRIDVFARFTDNALWHRASTSGSWTAWARLGGILTSAPAVTSWEPGRLDVFVRNVDDGLSHRAFDSSAWTPWERLGGEGTLSSSPAAAAWAPGRLDVFVRAAGNRLSHRAFNAGTGWTPWQAVVGGAMELTSQPAAASPASGRLDVVVRGTDSAMHLLRWTGSWSAWTSLGGTFSSGPGATDRGDDVHLAAASANGYRYEKVRSSPTGSWSAWRVVDPYLPFRRLASWVDTLDYSSLTPATAVADLDARGVRTLFLGTARFNGAADFFDQAEMAQWLDAAHAAGLKVVGWYVPAYGDLARDVRRTAAIGTYVSPTGQRFDAIGVDIERFGSDGEVDHDTFNARVVPHLQQVRAGTDAVVGAITPSPFGTDPGSRWTGFPWAGVGANSEVVVPMALWSFRNNFTPAEVKAWVADQVNRAQSLTGKRVHVEGGVLGEGSTTVDNTRVQAFVEATIDAGAIGGSQYDYRTTSTSFWSILAQLNTL
ncbi:PLL family lectin [Flindersiella endophytica]